MAKIKFWKYKISKNRYQIGTAAILPKYGIVKALHLTIDIDYHLFDTFPTKLKHKTFILRVDPTL